MNRSAPRSRCAGRRTGSAVPFGGPDERRRAVDAQEAQLLVEVAGRVLAPVVVADGEAAGDVLREAAEVPPHPLAERLQRPQPGGTGAGGGGGAPRRAGGGGGR